ncbi:MAG: cob(I)yrinic acid a,c-diamide adenosyltransferase [Anaerolineales bacterium]|nr:MAG: cob(I)yrinic acid a,c-diamide adenosyltransferase [Anaerolineales bacterium]
MPRLTKIYTKTGDDGSTALGSKQRVPKDHPRVRAYGTVDELNSVIGMALAHGLCAKLAAALPPIQNQLFHLGSDLSFPPEEAEEFKVPRIEQRHIDALEALIDEMNEELGPLENFILPGGSLGAATLQVARAVCRRAERRLVTLAREDSVRPESVTYVNRLSDALFVMARYENLQRGVSEPLWDSRE